MGDTIFSALTTLFSYGLLPLASSGFLPQDSDWSKPRIFMVMPDPFGLEDFYTGVSTSVFRDRFNRQLQVLLILFFGLTWLNGILDNNKTLQ
ncbi:hypothetical protein HPP92_001938 [Vanilla planifolia]|uniref:Uncharacterized protein n=1 Tax=Vanilla planifolia TaxID=51239 RepID=A0A835S4C4_VANPL|nr:hypothetical protein HPP92_001938 [Vanilla planifolia]